MASSSLPSWGAAVVAGFLKGSGVKTVVYDANLEFHRNHLFSNDPMGPTGFDLDLFREPSFYDPGKFMALKIKVNDCLAEASNPLDVFSRGRTLPGKEFFRQGSDNAVSRFWKQGLGRELDHHNLDHDNPGLVIFFVSSPHQAVPARIMAGFIRSKYPGVRVAAMAAPGTGLLENQEFDKIIQDRVRPGLALMADFIFQSFGIKMGPQESLPDFTGLPLGNYLAPARIFPVDPFYFQDPGTLSVFLEDQVKHIGAHGFVFIQDDWVDPVKPGERAEGAFIARLHSHLTPWLSQKDPKIYFSIQAPVSTDALEMETLFSDLISDLFSGGLKLIHWKIGNQVSEMPSKTLWKASKIGVWNHVQGKGWLRKDPGPAKFIVNNPNIIHSFQDTDQDCPPNKEGGPKVSPELQDYGRVEPLPGIPFWEHLGDKVYLLVYLSRMAKKELARLRSDLEKQSILTLGSQIRFFYQSPQELPPGVLDEICKMVDAGGSVDITHVRSNLERAYLVAYAMENGVIVGNSSLKHPRKEFIQRINQITGLDFTHFVERGYTSVRPEYRAMGVGAELLAGLTQRAKEYKVFSIISEDNLATQKIALRNQTRKIFTYFSEKLKKEMGVWMPEAMIDDSMGLHEPPGPLDPGKGKK